MAQSRTNTKIKEILKLKASKDDSGCDTCPEDSFIDNTLQDTDSDTSGSEVNKQRNLGKTRSASSISLRSSNQSKSNNLPNVGRTGSSPPIRSIMKTKQAKEDIEKSHDEDIIIEPKTRARKKASDISEDDKNKPTQEEPKSSKEFKKTVNKPKAIVKKRPLGIRKTLRSKKIAVTKEQVKNAIKKTVRRGRKPVRTETGSAHDKETVPLIPIAEIKKEPLDDTTPNSRSSSPKTAGRRQRLSSDIIMMKSMLADSPSSLVLGPRTSPYSTRSERSNSPSLFDGKNLRSGKPRKVKNNLLNEVVIKEQKKRRRLPSDSKTSDTPESIEECKKPKRGRSCSRDGSEISKCSDITELDLLPASLTEPLNESESNKEHDKKLDKSKTDLDVDIENNVQISSIEKVPSLNVDSKLAETKLDAEPSCNINEKNKKKLSLKRSTSLDSDNNNSNRLMLENLIASDIEDKLLNMKTENDTLFEAQARSSILTSMSETFNSKEIMKNMRKARRGRKAAGASRPNITQVRKNCVTSTIVTCTNDVTDDKQETLETLSKEIDDLINNLDQNIDRDHKMATESNPPEQNISEIQAKPVNKFYGLGESNSNIMIPDTPIKDKEAHILNEFTPSKNDDDSENIRLRYEDSAEKCPDNTKHEITYKCSTVASIDKLMDRLKEFEEFDKRRQRQESESKSNDSKPMMVTNDVVLITKSGADIKPLKDIQSVRSPEKSIEKENVLSCFENNSAISIVKRDQVRKSLDVDLPNSVTLYKRNSVSARKESTSSNHSKDSDAISIFEKSLGKDVTLTEIRKSVDKAAPITPVDLNQFATLHPNNPGQLVGVVLDPSQISIMPRVMPDTKPNNEMKIIITKRKSRESISRKSSESGNDTEEKAPTLEKVKSPQHSQPSEVTIISSSSAVLIPSPVAIKSPEATPSIDAEALPPPVDSIKLIPEDISLGSESSNANTAKIIEKDKDTEISSEVVKSVEADTKVGESVIDSKIIEPKAITENIGEALPEKMEINEKLDSEIPVAITLSVNDEAKQLAVEEKSLPEQLVENKPTEEKAKPVKSPVRTKSARNSVECQPGPSITLQETPESQKRKENVLRTLGLLTHKAAEEAQMEKLKEKERIYSGMMSNKSKAAKSSSGDYTGTLKTVIKLNRGTGDKDRKKHRSSLKMTFQKSKNRSGKPTPELGEAANEDDSYYTIERREGLTGAPSDETEAAPEPAEPKETLNLVIPEKASSFSIHPGRLCMDQCFYCGGKFGLFDTPCHIAQIKSLERQKKVLDNEEKLTIDSCLCDACYRHVDRRANCPSYRKRPPPKQPDNFPALTSPPLNTQSEKPVSPPLEEESEEEAPPATLSGRVATCHTEGCQSPAEHSIRRKWLIKMRASVNKVLTLKGDYPGLHTLPLCGAHHARLAPLLACALCRRRLTRHHNTHLACQDFGELNNLLGAVRVPVQLSEKAVLCKACRYYCSLLQRPGHHDDNAREYTRKLLQVYKVEVPPESDNEQEDTTTVQEDGTVGKIKKKQRTKSKQRKSSEPDKLESESSEKTNESTPEKNNEEAIKETPIEEDIESLISSNKIMVPGAVKNNETVPQSDSSEPDMVCEIEPILHVDKQTELQYLLQKQNNPAQFMQPKTNLTQKHKNIMKVSTLGGIQKAGQQHRIYDKNAKRIHKIGQIFAHKEKPRKDELEIFDEKTKEIPVLKNITLNDECTIESIPNKRPADINTLKNKWQMSESFTQVKKNLSELSKKLTIEKEPKKITDIKYSNPVRRLETNPSISVRELFPGEEEMNLQCNIEFNNVKGVTPEGWEKCNSMLQYDLETKKLWNELQRPYGNQSSFLRHLILLEKYFRSGDLVLSHNASPHAANYSDSVQSRLRAYDNVVNDAPRRSEPNISLIEFRKKPSTNAKSLLKTNHGEDKESRKFMPPPTFQKPKPKSTDKAKSKALPPELIAINTPNAQGRKAIQNVLHNIQQLVKGVSASDPTEVAAAPLPLPKFEAPKEKKETPKTETPKKTKPSSKPWRPTLMPITAENLAKIAREPTQVAVDGRNLPSLVQVMSSGKRYHITLQDYNKMCIMRREKLQQLQDGEKKRLSTEETTVVTEIQPSAMLGNGGTVVQNIPAEDKVQDKKEMPELSQISSNAATILKNVGLKNITIAPIPPKTATITSQTLTAPMVTSPSLIVTTPMKIPQLGPTVSITSETIINPHMPIVSNMIMPKIPKSLTVIPQTVVTSAPQNVVMATNVVPTTPVQQNSDGTIP